MRQLALALAATLAFSAPVFAQSVTIRGDGGPRVVVRDDVRHGRMHNWRHNDDRVVVRKRYRSIDRTGSVCKVTTVRRTTPSGDTVVRRIRRCS
ncbi:hypothetical protein [uncultured Alsobacter sp.]|uniref:hypothetical protein n=1 Tax=uncultured Alsobacter sp. TaxID=1748258 RepID=UPI0025EB7933|nr:hypothetical protein [uncultured Alsobacter sp.]